MSPAIAEMLPVVSPSGDDDNNGTTWTITDPEHPLTAGLPGAWVDPASCSILDPKPGATVVALGDNDSPMITCWQFDAATVVHINHTLTY